uniref:Uncharacterized protein n=1 Tax=uncultured marine virus TaxID=186617 RepID=A0A0F7L8W7_9VIRU|nr:hypothetical protein [uncultured marine virus]
MARLVSGVISGPSTAPTAHPSPEGGPRSPRRVQGPQTTATRTQQGKEPTTRGDSCRMSICVRWPSSSPLVCVSKPTRALSALQASTVA